MNSGFYGVPVKRPVAVIMATAAALVFGLVSYAKLPLSLFPELTYPTLTIRTNYLGAAPEEIEEAVIRPIEELVATVDGLVRMRSVARADSGDVVLEFGWGWSMVVAAQEVRERLDLLQLPDEVARPLLLRYDPTLDPVLRLGLHSEPGSLGLGELRDYGDLTLRRQIERIPGVAAVTVAGGEEREVSVELNGARLAAVGLTPREVVARLRAENINLAGGDLSEGDAQYLVRTLHQLRTLDAIRSLALVRRDQAIIRLGDVANVQLATKNATHAARFLGREGVELAVYKEADVNLVAVAGRVKMQMDLDPRQRRIRKMQGKPAPLTLPKGVHAVLLTDQSRFIEAALSEVRSNALVGGVLAMVVLFVFLRRFRTTFIAALAIPVSVGVTFAPLYISGVSLNVMSLGGLALGIGMLVDNAVVVLESIARCHEQGDDIPSAAVRGVREVGGAVAAATVTTVAVFAPMIFVEGIAGQVFGDLALSVVIALLASLAVALSLIPMLASRTLPTEMGDASLHGVGGVFRRYLAGLKATLAMDRSVAYRLLLSPYILLRLLLALVLGAVGLIAYSIYVGGVALFARLINWLRRRETSEEGRLFSAVDRLYNGLEQSLVSLLRRAFVRPSLILLPAFLVLLGSAALLPGLGSSLVPEIHRGIFDVRASMPVGTPLKVTLQSLQSLEKSLAQHPEVELLSAFAGISDEVWRQSAEGEHTAHLRVRLKEGGGVARREESVMAFAREKLADVPGAQGRIERPAMFSFSAPIEVNVSGLDLPSMRQAAMQVHGELQRLDTLSDVKTTAVEGFPEVRVELRDTSLAQFGLSADGVARSIRDQVHGRVASTFRPKRRSGERFDIVVRGDMGQVPKASDLANLIIGYAGGIPIPLGAVADLNPGFGPVDVRHVDGIRAVAIEAGLAPGVDLAGAVTSIRARLSTLQLPMGVDVSVTGQEVERRQAMASLRLALLLAAFLVYAVLAAQFESYVHPLLIMVTVPLGLVGAVLGLALTGTPISILVLIGGITLVGIVVNNAIVLLDRVRRERMAGSPVEQALITAVRMRLRPILMTTMTTVFGLLPLALSTGEGAEIRAPIAVTLISGLLFSTLLTLLVTPVLFRLITRDRVSPPQAG